MPPGFGCTRNGQVPGYWDALFRNQGLRGLAQRMKSDKTIVATLEVVGSKIRPIPSVAAEEAVRRIDRRFATVEPMSRHLEKLAYQVENTMS
jgi:hypothetical protein